MRIRTTAVCAFGVQCTGHGNARTRSNAHHQAVMEPLDERQGLEGHNMVDMDRLHAQSQLLLGHGPHGGAQ